MRRGLLCKRICRGAVGHGTAPGRQFHNAGGHSFTIDPHKTSDFSSQDNISFAEYAEAKLTALEKYLQDVDKYASAKPATPADLYIRADFTDWNVKDDWELELGEDGLWRIEISRSDSFRFKVYSKALGAWFGSEVLTEDTAVSWETDGHTNIILPAGTYTVVFDPAAQTIFIAEG